jgi:hypothetical protein
MFLSKIKVSVAVVLVVAVLGGTGVGVYYLRAQAPVPKSEKTSKKPEEVQEIVQPSKFFEGEDKIFKEFNEPLKRPDVAVRDKKAAGKLEERFQKLLKARREMAEQEWKLRSGLFNIGANEPGTGNPVTLHLVFDASKRLLKVELDQSNKKAERLEVRQRQLNRMKEITDVTEAQYKAGRMSKAAFASALYEQLDAEIELEREKAR